MITLRFTQEGLEVKRFLPFIVFGNKDRGANSSTVDEFSYPPSTEKGGKYGNKKTKS